MRRPHPRFDCRRNAWVTNAGGKLKTLASGPKTAQTEAAAWEAFYAYMAHLGRPACESAPPAITLGLLADQYGDWMNREVAAGRLKPATRDYYRPYLQRFLDAVGGRRDATAVLPIELERHKTSWHSVQAVQRLYNWGVKMGLLSANPLAGISRPEAGCRKRVLSPVETARLLRAADRNFRPFLLLMRHTIARPQEVRAFKWTHLTLNPVPMFVLTEFKAKNLRKDKAEERRIPLDDRMVRLLGRLARRQPHDADRYVLLNRHGKPWTSNAIRCRMRRLRLRVGLGADERGEQVVAYTLRHTAATQATARGVRDRMLAELMGHANLATTRLYQHPQIDHLYYAIKQANRRLPQ